MSKILKAKEFAAAAHEGVYRKWSGKPYFSHVSNVANRVAVLSVVTEEIIAAAWLHDVVEDTKWTLDDIRELFGEKVAVLVGELTNPPKDLKLSRAERKAVNRKHLSEISVEAKSIKLVDRIDNLSSKEAPAEFMEKYIAESKLLLEVLKGVDSELEEELSSLLN